LNAYGEGCPGGLPSLFLIKNEELRMKNYEMTVGISTNCDSPLSPPLFERG
jgi:hypothetical protein